jgi:HK97 family phage major capsid protein
MTRNERKLRAVSDEMQRYSGEIKSVWKKAEDEDRETTPEEREDVEKHLKAIETLKEQKSELEDAIKVEEEVSRHAKEIGPTDSAVTDAKVTNEPEPFMSLGKQFTESDQYKSVVGDGGLPGGQWRTGQIDLEAKGTLLGAGTIGGYQDPVQYQPGVVETLFQRLYVADLLAQGQTSSPQVRYNKETTATNAAAGVAEGGAKPESALAFTEVTEPVKKIATVLPVSDEMLEDANQIEAYINQRLSLFVKIKEENSILRGAGSDDLQGIIGRSGVNTVSVSGTSGTAIVENLFTVLNNTRGSSLLEPDAIVMNPTNWAALRTSKDANNQYFGGGPFYGQYGGAGFGSGSQFSTAENVWGVKVVVTSAIGAGTALVGSFREGAQVFRRSGLTVEASNSHSDYFVKNLTAIRAEERLALAVYRPSAFTTVTLT